MKKRLCMFAAALFATAPVFAAEGARVAVNGEWQDREEPDAGYVFRENGRAMLPVRWMAGQCGITKESGAGKIPLVQAIAENAGLRMRWDTDTRTAYFMDQEHVLYENEEFGIGVLLPEGAEDDYTILEGEITSEEQPGRHFVVDFCWNGCILFYLTYFDLDYWENEVRENFPISYSEVYRDHDGIWLCVNVSDVQVDPEDEKQKAEYEKHLAYKEEICASFYTFTE